LDEVADFYERHKLSARILVSDGSPDELDALLDGLGYVAEAHSSVQTAVCADVLARAERLEQIETRISETLTDDWLDLFLRMEQARLDRKEAYRAIMSAIGPRKCFLQVLIEGKTVGVGMAVAECGWAGFYNIATDAHYRRRGVGTQIVRSLVEWGSQNGATHLYLQVMKNNTGALAPYEKLGFSHLYSYHYRTKLEG
jgi:ribosomal protein S18 acetylase RimI-like enzyme